MSDLDDAAVNSHYVIHGVDAVLDLGSNGTFDVVVIDETSGVSVGQTVQVQTIVPACSIRMTELAENELTPRDLLGALITFNDSTWRSRDNRPKPNLGGEPSGELFLFLEAVT